MTSVELPPVVAPLQVRGGPYHNRAMRIADGIRVTICGQTFIVFQGAVAHQVSLPLEARVPQVVPTFAHRLVQLAVRDSRGFDRPPYWELHYVEQLPTAEGGTV